MKLDSSLLRDVLKVDRNGEVPVTAQQWLRFPSNASPSKSEIQQAYQKQVERLKRAREKFDLEQLRYASKQIRQAALELKAEVSGADNPESKSATGANSPAKQLVAPPIDAPVPMATPIARPLSSSRHTEQSPPNDSVSANSGVAIDVHAKVKKKRRGKGLFAGLLAIALLVISGAVLFTLRQMEIIDWNQLADRSPADSVGEPDSNTDDSDLGGTGPLIVKPLPNQENSLTPNSTEQIVGAAKNDQKKPPTVVVSNGTDAQLSRPAVEDWADEKPALIVNGDQARPGQPDNEMASLPFKINYADMTIQQWYEAANRFEVGLAAIVLDDQDKSKSTIESLLEKSESWGTPPKLLASFLGDMQTASQAFDSMLKKRLPLLERTGEIQVNGKPVSVVTCRPNNYVIRISGANRRFSDDDLPLGLRLAMFNGVVPEAPFDDVCIHVFKCLPYLRGDSDLKASLLKRLDSTATMQPGNIYDKRTIEKLHSFVSASGSVSQWLAAQAGAELKRERNQIADVVQLHQENAVRLPQRTSDSMDAMMQALNGRDDSAVVSVRDQVVEKAMREGEIAVAVDILRDQLVWSENVAPLESGLYDTLTEKLDGKQESEKWLTEIEAQLRNSANDPLLNQALIELGEAVAAQFQRRQVRRWKAKLKRALQAGEEAAVSSPSPSSENADN